MNMLSSRLACATAALAVGLLAAGAARADVITIAVAVNGGAVTNEKVGVDAASWGPSATGGYNVNIVSGIGNGVLPPGSLLAANALDANSGTPTSNVLDVYITETGITNPTGLQDFISTFTQNSLSPGWSVQESTWLNVNNRRPSFFPLGLSGFESHSIMLGSVTDTTATTIGHITSATVDAGAGPYSLTALYVINPCASATGRCVKGFSSATTNIGVPEPGTLALFGAGLLGCALFIGRRRRES